MNAPATIERQSASRTPNGSIKRAEATRTPVFQPPADAPVLQGSRAPVRVATDEHHEPKAFS